MDRERRKILQRIYGKRYWEKHKKERYAKHLEWLHKNKDKKREYNKRYRKKFYEREKNRYLRWSNSVAGKEARRKWRIKNRDKVKAHYLANEAVKHGIIKRPSFCKSCGKKGRTEMHHGDYRKPFDVIFVCNACHAAQHRL